MSGTPLEATAAELQGRGPSVPAPGLVGPRAQSLHISTDTARAANRGISQVKIVPRMHAQSAINPAPAIKTRNGPDASSFSEAFAFMRGSSDVSELFHPVAPMHGAGSCAEGAGLYSAGSALGTSSVGAVDTTRVVAPSGASNFAGSGRAAVPLPAAPTSKLHLQVSLRQKGNPILPFVRNVAWGYDPGLGAEGPDYVVGVGACVLYLSLKHHMMRKQYIYQRIKQLRRPEWKLRVLLALVDVADAEEPLAELAVAAMHNDLTLLCAFSAQEAGRYLETLKAYEHKGAESIQERAEALYLPRAQEALTVIRSINKTDVLTLLGHCGSVAGILTASREELAVPPGIGDKKMRRLYEAFHTPFAGQGAETAGYGGLAAQAIAQQDEDEL